MLSKDNLRISIRVERLRLPRLRTVMSNNSIPVRSIWNDFFHKPLMECTVNLSSYFFLTHHSLICFFPINYLAFALNAINRQNLLLTLFKSINGIANDRMVQPPPIRLIPLLTEFYNIKYYLLFPAL